MEKYSTQKQLKDLKKDIIANSAVNIGYHYSIMQKLPNYALIEAVKEISSARLISLETQEAEAQNIIVTEAIKAMNFQDSKEVAKFFL